MSNATEKLKTLNEIYSHIYNFFRRHYSEGNFISLNCTIPHNGDGVKLCWVNQDQYYVKTITDRKTFDYFIHKDLGGFLRRELDFYIKNEVMHLDDIESETAPRVEQYLSKIKAIRRIAHKIIDFLAQIENFQKRLWLKKKFVVETQYCITLDRIFAIEDEKVRDWLLDQIVKNDAQREEWISLFAIDEINGDLATPGYSNPLKPEFLKAHPTLVVDTRHFDEAFKLRLLAAIPDIDEETDGTKWLCLFKPEHLKVLPDMWLRTVKVVGEAVGEPNKERTLHVASVVPLENEIEESSIVGEAEELPFWTSLPLDDLVELQGVQPAEDLDQISALWPADDDPDRMLAYILEERSARRRIAREGHHE